MTAGFGFCKRPFVGALALGWLVCTMSAQGQEIRFMPVAVEWVTPSEDPLIDPDLVCMPGDGKCGHTEIKLVRGDATVTLFLELSGWDPGGNAGNPDYWLGAWQGTVDHTGYAGDMGCDLVPIGQPSMGFEGAFQALKVCADAPYNCDPGVQDLMTACTSAADCAAGQLCMDRCDFIYFQLDATCTISTATIDYSWSCASTDCREDPYCDPSKDCRYYAGTLLLYVPDCKAGTYTVNFVDDENFTLFNNCPVS